MHRGARSDAGSQGLRGMLTLDELVVQVRQEEIDTVVVAFTDMQGRLLGKRLQAEYFIEEAQANRAIGSCNYLMAVDMEMNPSLGYEMASWERGYGDFSIVPDFSTLRRVPWLEGTALVLCDVLWSDGSPVRPSPRQMLKVQVERVRALGYEPMFGSELEFYLLKETYAEAHARNYRGLTPSVPYVLDYHILATTYDEAFLRTVRNGMQAAGIPIESSKGEAWPGQQEINFRFTDAVTMADNHTIYKNGIKEIAHQHGCSVTFMAKPDHTWMGSSCHIHSSLWSQGDSAFTGESPIFRRYLAGQIAASREFAIFLAPNVNSYKRYSAGTWAPTTLGWGYDNRSCGFRVVGQDQSVRIENRIPGADANPYLAFAATLAAGVYGIEHELEPPPAVQGNAYIADSERFPTTLLAGIRELEEGTVARAAFGGDVVDHYLNYARTEQALFDRFVTEYERVRLFERG